MGVEVACHTGVDDRYNKSYDAFMGPSFVCTSRACVSGGLLAKQQSGSRVARNSGPPQGCRQMRALLLGGVAGRLGPQFEGWWDIELIANDNVTCIWVRPV